MPWSWPIYYSKVAQILKIPHTERFRNLPGYLFATLGFYFDLGPRLSLCSYCLRNCLLWCAIGYCFSILSYSTCLQLYPGKLPHLIQIRQRVGIAENHSFFFLSKIGHLQARNSFV